MASYRNENRPDSGDLLSWIITIVLLVSPVWPIGLILLLRKLTGGSRRRASRHPYDIQREGGPVPGTQGMPGAQRQTPPVGRQHVGRSPRQGRPVNLDRGKGLTVWGIVLTVIFGIALTGFPAVAMSGGFLSALAVMSPVIGFFGGGLAMIWAGTQRTKKAKRFRKYLALIGRRESISITTLAQAMPVSVHKACDDLQDMLDSGILETGYLDMSTGRLILSDEGLQEEAPPAPEPDEPEPEEDVLDMNDDDAVLGEIRRLNDDIDDPVMSQKIDRIGEITGKIFAYQKQSPNRAGQLRSFLSYYLPTTLKILRAYARMEEQGVEGENIRSAKARIEGMMDKVVEGFEKQLDKLFQDDAMDIATDVQVLERMLEKDGLSGGPCQRQGPPVCGLFGMIGGIRTGMPPIIIGIRIPCAGPGTRRWSGPAYSRFHCWPIRPPCPQRAHSPVRRPRTEWGRRRPRDTCFRRRLQAPPCRLPGTDKSGGPP